MRNDKLIALRKLTQRYAYISIQMHETIAKKAGFSGTDHKYLGFFLQKGVLTAGELAELSGLTTGAVTGLIDRFEKKGLVKRQFDEKDRRKVIIVPDSEKIMAIFEPFYKDFQAETDNLIAAFSDEELKTLEIYFLNAIALMSETKNKFSEKKQMELKINDNGNLSLETFYHGTKADLKNGDLIAAGFNSNYGSRNKAKYVYFAATLEASIWGAELAMGDEKERIYIVEPTGVFEDDPNLTNKRFPGNPTKSYRTMQPLRVIGEVSEWQGHSPEQLKAMNDHLEQLKQRGIEAIEE